MPTLSINSGLFLCVLLLLSSCKVFEKKSAQTRSIGKHSTSFSKGIEAPLIGNIHADVCEIFAQKPTWYQSAIKSQKKWRIPIHVMMSIIKQESAFRAKARPPQRQTVNLFGRKRKPSSAYGYAQAQNPAWKDYQKYTKKFKHRRDVFEHAIYFVGWYAAQARRVLKLKNYDTYNIYLSYHEGLTGFRLKTYKKKPWLTKVAKKVQTHGYRYAKQLKKCAPALNKNKGSQLILASNATQKSKNNHKKRSQTRSKKAKVKQHSFDQSTKGCTKIFGVWPLCTPFQR